MIDVFPVGQGMIGYCRNIIFRLDISVDFEAREGPLKFLDMTGYFGGSESFVSDNNTAIVKGNENISG